MPIKRALVIGNAEYDTLSPLPACGNDRLEVGRVLNKEFGFHVTQKPDCGYSGLRSALMQFVNAYRTDPGRQNHGGDVVRSPSVEFTF